MIANCKVSSAKLCHFSKNNRSIVHKTGFLARKVGLLWSLCFAVRSPCCSAMVACNSGMVKMY